MLEQSLQVPEILKEFKDIFGRLYFGIEAFVVEGHYVVFKSLDRRGLSIHQFKS